MLNNSLITRESIKHGLSIWRPSVPKLNGKTTRRRTDNVVLNEATVTPISHHILNNNPSIVLGMDVVKVNGVLFLVTTSRIIKLGSTTELKGTKIATIVSALLVIMDQYNTRDFNILAIAADHTFESMRQNEAL